MNQAAGGSLPSGLHDRSDDGQPGARAAPDRRPGRNIHLEYRWAAGDIDRTRAYAAELVTSAPEMLVGNGTPALTALRDATRSIPRLAIFIAQSSSRNASLEHVHACMFQNGSCGAQHHKRGRTIMSQKMAVTAEKAGNPKANQSQNRL